MWDYPRPPRLERSTRHLVVELGGKLVAHTGNAFRVLETSQPPAYYFPPGNVAAEHLRPSTGRTFCEWKGLATYWSVVAGDRVAVDAAWSYPQPTPAFAPLADHIAFYPQLMDACWVDGERVAPSEGSFYGGWVTSKVVGPFKGGPGTAHW